MNIYTLRERLDNMFGIALNGKLLHVQVCPSEDHRVVKFLDASDDLKHEVYSAILDLIIYTGDGIEVHTAGSVKFDLVNINSLCQSHELLEYHSHTCEKCQITKDAEGYIKETWTFDHTLTRTQFIQFLHSSGRNVASAEDNIKNYPEFGAMLPYAEISGFDEMWEYRFVIPKQQIECSLTYDDMSGEETDHEDLHVEG